VFVYKRNYFTK